MSLDWKVVPIEDWPEAREWRAELWALIEATPHLDWQLLTKRPENVMGMVPDEWADGFPPNVWIGTSVENQEYAERRVPELLMIPAAVRFLSCEPLLGPVNLRRFGPGGFLDALGGHSVGKSSVHWVIVGGESGKGARPFDIAWGRELIRQCAEAGVACFVKQLGSRACEANVAGPSVGEYPLRLRDKKGGDWSEWPADLRVRQMPETLGVSHG